LDFPLPETSIHPGEALSEEVIGGNETVLVVDDSAEKPYRMDDLGKALRRNLDRKLPSRQQANPVRPSRRAEGRNKD